MFITMLRRLAAAGAYGAWTPREVLSRYNGTPTGDLLNGVLLGQGDARLWNLTRRIRQS